MNDMAIRRPGSKLNLSLFDAQQIAVLKIFPGIQFEAFESILTPNLRGIVFEAYGAGNIPDSDGTLDRFLTRAKQNGTIIVVCTQCLRGSASIGDYATSLSFQNAGAVSGYDMTVESAVTKLYYLLSLGCGLSEVKRLMETNLRGELSN